MAGFIITILEPASPASMSTRVYRVPIVVEKDALSRCHSAYTLAVSFSTLVKLSTKNMPLLGLVMVELFLLWCR